jgi:hypothetical protein
MTIKRDLIDVESVRAFVATHAEACKVEPLPEKCSKEKAHNAYLLVVKALEKTAVEMFVHDDDDNPKASCGAKSPGDCKDCPYCGASLEEKPKVEGEPEGEKKEDKALVRNDGDKLESIETYEENFEGTRKDLHGSVEQLYRAGQRLKVARDQRLHEKRKKGNITWEQHCLDLGISMATAANFIRVVEAYPDPLALPKIPLRDIYQIVSVPQEHREELLKLAERADGSGKAELEAKVKEIRAKVHPVQSAFALKGVRIRKKGSPNALGVPDSPTFRKGTQVKSDKESPLVTIRIGDRLKARWISPDGKKLQLADVVKKCGIASFAIGRHVRVVVSVTNDGAILEVRADGEK